MAILLQRTSGIAELIFDRPEAANAIDMAFAEELAAATGELARDATVRAVLVRANGKHFSVGGDLKGFASLGEGITPALRSLADRLHEGILHLQQLTVPVVVAVHGNAAGAGMSLALLGDACLAARSSRFRVAYTAVALTPDGGASWMLPRLVGLRVATELALTNRIVNADEALRLGIVNRIVDDEHLQAEAFDLTRQLADGPTAAYANTKRLMSGSATSTFEDQLVQEPISLSESAGTAEGQEGISAFVEKRTANFHGSQVRD
jgi:2-(1,2-epoxy-1,2-dihydrophenyl)acetyl-CoA isomerase